MYEYDLMLNYIKGTLRSKEADLWLILTTDFVLQLWQ